MDLTREELKALDMYYNRPAGELIFLAIKEHSRLHNEYRKGKHRSDETRRKISEAHKGKHLSEETKRKLSEARLGMHFSEETKRKLSEAKKGWHWKVIDGKRTWLPVKKEAKGVETQIQ